VVEEVRVAGLLRAALQACGNNYHPSPAAVASLDEAVSAARKIDFQSPGTLLVLLRCLFRSLLLFRSFLSGSFYWWSITQQL
jgi:hypothetical protein